MQTPSGLSSIGTDSRWRVKESCISQIGTWSWNKFGGEHFDAREFVPGWNMAGLDDSSWSAAGEIDAPDVVHSWQGCESVRLSSPVSPKKIFQIKSGKWVIDFGRPLTGWMDFKMHALKPGQQVQIYYADLNCHNYDQKMHIGGTIEGFQHFNQQDTYITEGGSPATKVKGVTFLRTEKGKSLFKVGSGNYEFKSVMK